jgi:hypothetical protein
MLAYPDVAVSSPAPPVLHRVLIQPILDAELLARSSK